MHLPANADFFQGMVPESHEIVLPATVELRDFLKTTEFEQEVRQTLKSSYEVDLEVRRDSSKMEKLDLNDDDDDAATATTAPPPPAPPTIPTEERLLLQYTRNNAGGLKDAIDFLVSRLMPHGLDANTVKGAIPRPKSDSFEDSLPFFDSKLLHNAPTPLNGNGSGNGGTDSPTRSTFGGVTGDDASDRGSLFGKIRKPGSISSISSFLDRRKNQSNTSISFFKQASSNASRASLVSMESRDSGYRNHNHNPWNDSGVNLPEGDEPPLPSSGGFFSHINGSVGSVGSFGMGGNANANINTNGTGNVNGSGQPAWPPRFENKSERNLPLFANSTFISTSSSTPAGVVGNGMSMGDVTPRYGTTTRASHDSGRPSTSHSTNGIIGNGSGNNGYPVPIGPPR